MRSNNPANPGGAVSPAWCILQQAIRLPREQWTKLHWDAVAAVTPILFAMAWSILRGFGLPTDYHFCSDAVQQWWELVLGDGLFSLKPHYGFSKFARVFMMRACGRLAGRRGGRRTRPIDEASDIWSNEPNPAELADQLQTHDEILAELGRLSDTLRQPLICMYYDGLTLTETAAKLGVTPNAVSKRFFDAKKILRLRLRRFCD